MKSLFLRIMFVITGGTLYSERFRHNKLLVSIMVTISLLSSYYLARAVIDDLENVTAESLLSNNIVKFAVTTSTLFGFPENAIPDYLHEQLDSPSGSPGGTVNRKSFGSGTPEQSDESSAPKRRKMIVPW